MAYTPINWQTGDTITADKLNKMDNGWSVESTQLFSETVTTEEGRDGYSATLAYGETIDNDSITVTFDGMEYTCPRIDVDDMHYYGGFVNGGQDFTTYPFLIAGHDVYTETAGEHTIAVSVPTIQTSADFDKARGYYYVTGNPTELFSETVTMANQGGIYGATLAYSGAITADTITVTYDSTEYTCPSIGTGEYGASYNGSSFDFSEFPFNLYTESGTPISLVTQTAGEHTIAVTAAVTSMQTSDDFKIAVQPIVDDAIAALKSLPLLCISNQTPYFVMNTAQDDGRLMYFQHQMRTYFISNVSQNISGTNKIAEFFPANDSITVGFNNNIFTVTG